MKLFLAGLIAGATMAVTASSALAVTTYSTPTAGELAALALTSTAYGGWASNDASVVAGSLENVYRSPFGPSSRVEYFAAGDLGATIPNPATIVFNSLKTDFSFLWGSPDSYNEITFINTIAGTSVTLADLIGNTVGLYTGAGAVFVKVADIAFDQVKFKSIGKQALEFSNIVATPVPAGMALLGGGLAMLGYLGTRRRRQIPLA